MSGITASVGAPTNDLDTLASTTTALGAAGEYDSGFISVDRYKQLCGIGYATHDTIGTVTYTDGGSSLDDATIAGPYTDTTSRDYEVEIDAAGATDTFKWSKDGGSTYEATGVAITGSEQTLDNGVTVTFGATTGHAVGDKWAFTANRSSATLEIIQSQDGENEDGDTLSKTIYNAYPSKGSWEVDVIAPYAKLKITAGSRALTSLRAAMNGKVG